MYEDFQILLDEPARSLALGFDDYGDALTEVVLRSRPQFAVGIFGDWGSGKTTLMEGIARQLEPRDDVVQVWFNAWRYEQEPHLIVPMLDTLREGLLDWAARPTVGDAQRRSWATRAAAAASRAALAVLAGVTLQAAVPIIGLSASIDANKSVAAWRSDSEDQARASAEEPRSFYHASFRALRDAMREFVGKGAGRIVVFVDDLDRCLPENALQVLESMKLFFDLPGFVFVVGLDQRVIEQAVELRYQPARSAQRSAPRDGDRPGAEDPRDPSTARSQAEERATLTGANYVKKIFQVQFSVPRIVEEQLGDYLRFVAEEAGLPQVQRDNLRDTVSPHLPYLVAEGSVNPREVKRLINAYTLQVKMLERRLQKPPNPNVVLALQTMLFRHDWEPLYQVLAPEPSVFVEELEQVLAGRGDLFLGGRSVALPAAFATYVRGPGKALRDEPLEPYVSSIEAALSTDSSMIEATRVLRELRKSLDPAAAALPDANEFGGKLGHIRDVVGRRSSDDAFSADAVTRLRNLEGLGRVSKVIAIR
jgi:hypothetical protein